MKNKRESLMRELDILTQPISVDDDIKNEDLEKCYKIIKELLNKQDLEVSELTLVASFRYALGRKRYVVSAIVEDILNNWSSLSIKFKTKIKEEIQEAMKNNNAGSDIDIEQWNRILEKDDEIVFTKKDLNTKNVGVNDVLDFIRKNQPTKAIILADNFKTISKRTIEKYLKQLKDENKIEFRGSSKTGGYVVK